MAQKQLRTEIIYEAIQPFVFGNRIVQAGHTVVAGHPLLRGRMSLFRPWSPTFGPEDGEEEPAAPDAGPAAEPAATGASPD